MWLHANTQWRAAGLGLIGLDYLAVKAVARDLGIEWTAGMWRKMLALERFETSREGAGDDSFGGHDKGHRPGGKGVAAGTRQNAKGAKHRRSR